MYILSDFRGFSSFFDLFSPIFDILEPKFIKIVDFVESASLGVYLIKEEVEMIQMLVQAVNIP